MAVTAEPLTQAVLLFGSFVALIVGIVGRRVKASDQEFKMAVRVVSAIAGVIMIIWAFILVIEGGWELLFILIFLILGVGLLFPLLPRINLGTILALIIAAVLAFAIADYIELIWVLVIFLVSFFALWLVLGIVFRAVRGVGRVLGSRVVLLVVGIIGVAMAIYSLFT